MRHLGLCNHDNRQTLRQQLNSLLSRFVGAEVAQHFIELTLLASQVFWYPYPDAQVP